MVTERLGYMSLQHSLQTDTSETSSLFLLFFQQPRPELNNFLDLHAFDTFFSPADILHS